MNHRPVTIAVLGAGGRGFGFAEIVSRMPQGARVAAVAEPRKEYREEFARRFDVPAAGLFRDWQEFVTRPRMADAVVVSTMDRDHVAPAVACLGLGYHLFLEKPMAVSLEDCRRIAKAQEKAGTITCVCHSMRYHKAFSALRDVVAGGRIGRMVSLDQIEQVAWWHQAHSFVRGNWGNEGRSTFMLLAKSCHDIDYIASLIPGACLRVSSFGGLAWFTRDNAPAGSGDRCVSCAVEPECPYSAVRTYVDTDRTVWPANVVSLDHARDAHWKAIEIGPYGRCVWKCDNDVVDHQVAAMEFEGGMTATFTMTAFTQEGGRRIRVHGTEGDVEFGEENLTVRTFADGNVEHVRIGKERGGHGGGDQRVMTGFLRAVREGRQDLVTTDVHESLRTHTIVFAAEASRRTGKTMEIEGFGG